MAKRLGYSLWYMRPKIHMMQHVVFPSCILSFASNPHSTKKNLAAELRLQSQHELANPDAEWIFNPHSLELNLRTYTGDVYCMVCIIMWTSL